jgi:hypothetical protein
MPEHKNPYEVPTVSAATAERWQDLRRPFYERIIGPVIMMAFAFAGFAIGLMIGQARVFMFIGLAVGFVLDLAFAFVMEAPSHPKQGEHLHLDGGRLAHCIYGP